MPGIGKTATTTWINGRKEWTWQAHLGKKKAGSRQHESGKEPRAGGALRRGRPQARHGAWSWQAVHQALAWGALELGTLRPTAQH